MNLNDSSCDITVMILNYQQRGTTRHNTSRYGIQRHGKRINQALFKIRKHESILKQFFKISYSPNFGCFWLLNFFYGENLKLKTWNLTLKIERSAPVSTNCENCENFYEKNRYHNQWELLAIGMLYNNHHLLFFNDISIQLSVPPNYTFLSSI